MKTYKKALEYINSFQDYEKTGFRGFNDSLDLGRILSVLKDLGEPENTYRSVHISGTKGKGSVSSFTASVLGACGYKVGLYTSPHLHDILERVKVNGKNVSSEVFTYAVAEISEHINGKKNRFTYFEILTLTAILIFKKENVDFAVFETGLGGRMDATNVICAEVSGITPISFDHTYILGDTIGAIAKEKAGIIKKNKICVSGRQSEKAADVIKEKCLAENCKVLFPDEDYFVEIKEQTVSGTIFGVETPRAKYKDLRSSMLGSFQAYNAAQAICICEEMLKGEINASHIKQGIETTFIPARLEIISADPLIIVDGAQNGESTKKLKYSVEQIFKYDKLILLLGLSEGKDAEAVCRNLGPMAEKIILTRSGSARAMDPYLIRGYFKRKKVFVTSDTKEALGRAIMETGKKDLILVTGSFYVAAEIREQVLGSGAQMTGQEVTG